MVGQELDEQKEDLLVTVVDIQPTDVHTVSGDNLYPSHLEVSAMNGALVFLVPPPDLGDVLIEGRLMQIKAELDVGARRGPQSERVHPLAHEPVKRADHRLSMTAGRPLWCALDRAALADRRVSRSLHKCRPSAAHRVPRAPLRPV